MRLLVAAIMAAASCAAADTSPDGLRKLVRQALVNLEKTSGEMDSYEFLIQSENKESDGRGGLKTHSAVVRRTYLDGFPIGRIVSRDGAPLSGSDLREHEEKLAKRVAEWKAQSPEQRAKDIGARRKRNEEENAWHREAADALDYRLAGEESMDGRKTIVLQITPHPGYRPSRLWAKVFLQMTGKIWVDPEEAEIAQVDVGLLDDVTVAWGIAGRVDRGTRYFLNRKRLAPGIWVTGKQTSKYVARLVFKNVQGENSAVFSEYTLRKDQAARATR